MKEQYVSEKIMISSFSILHTLKNLKFWTAENWRNHSEILTQRLCPKDAMTNSVEPD